MLGRARHAEVYELWSGVRVAEGTALEMRCAGNCTEGSNPSRSVSHQKGRCNQAEAASMTLSATAAD